MLLESPLNTLVHLANIDRIAGVAANLVFKEWSCSDWQDLWQVSQNRFPQSSLHLSRLFRAFCPMVYLVWGLHYPGLFINRFRKDGVLRVGRLSSETYSSGVSKKPTRLWIYLEFLDLAITLFESKLKIHPSREFSGFLFSIIIARNLRYSMHTLGNLPLNHEDFEEKIEIICLVWENQINLNIDKM